MRFHRQMPDGTFVEQTRRESPFENSAAWLPGIGDFNGDGLPDLAVRWEGIPPAEIQLLRNDGNFQFTDITLQALGTYHPGGTNNSGMLAPSPKAALTDVNRDGFADLVLSLFGVSINSLLTTSCRLSQRG